MLNFEHVTVSWQSPVEPISQHKLSDSTPLQITHHRNCEVTIPPFIYVICAPPPTTHTPRISFICAPPSPHTHSACNVRLQCSDSITVFQEIILIKYV
jgi:hypothetical protein